MSISTVVKRLNCFSRAESQSLSILTAFIYKELGAGLITKKLSQVDMWDEQLKRLTQQKMIEQRGVTAWTATKMSLKVKNTSPSNDDRLQNFGNKEIGSFERGRSSGVNNMRRNPNSSQIIFLCVFFIRFMILIRSVHWRKRHLNTASFARLQLN